MEVPVEVEVDELPDPPVVETPPSLEPPELPEPPTEELVPPEEPPERLPLLAEDPPPDEVEVAPLELLPAWLLDEAPPSGGAQKHGPKPPSGSHSL